MRRFTKNLLPILDQISLMMKSGKPFRQAISNISLPGDRYSELLIQEFYIALTLKKPVNGIARSVEIKKFFENLEEVDQTNHRQIEFISSLRRKISTVQNFRQKSRQALIQTRAQSLVASIIYICVSLFIQFEFGLRKHFALFLFSLCLFLLGLFIIFTMGSKHKWKI